MNGAGRALLEDVTAKLPAGWRIATIGSCVAELIGGASPSEKDYTDIGVLVLNKGDIKTYGKLSLKGSVKRTSPAFASKHASKIISTRSLVVTLRDLSSKADFLGLISLYEGTEAALITQGMYSILLNQDVLDRFLMYYSNAPAYRTIVKREKHGATQVHLRNGEFLSIPIPLAPISEQRRIVQRLDDVVEKVEACRARLIHVHQILTKFREAVLQAAVLGKLTEEWRVEHGVSSPEKEVQLEDVWKDSSYGSAAKSKSIGMIPVLRMGNIQNGALDWRDLVYTSDTNEISKYKLQAGDVLFNRTNSPGLVGKTAVYHGERPAIYAGYLIRVRCGDRLHPDYLGCCLNSPAGRHYCWSVKTDGVSQSNINASKLGAFSFLLPCVQEQVEIVRRVAELFSLVETFQRRYDDALTRLASLTPSVLAKAFRGELVAQNPSDEPAGEMRLARNDQQALSSRKTSHARG